MHIRGSDSKKGYAVVLVLMLSGVILVSLTALLHRDGVLGRTNRAVADFSAAMVERRGVEWVVGEAAAAVFELDSTVTKIALSVLDTERFHDDMDQTIFDEVAPVIEKVVEAGVEGWNVNPLGDFTGWEITPKFPRDSNGDGTYDTFYSTVSHKAYPAYSGTLDYMDASEAFKHPDFAFTVRDRALLEDAKMGLLWALEFPLVRTEREGALNYDGVKSITASIMAWKVPLINWNVIAYLTPFSENPNHKGYNSDDTRNAIEQLGMVRDANGVSAFWDTKGCSALNVMPATGLLDNSHSLPGVWRSKVAVAWSPYDYILLNETKGAYPQWVDDIRAGAFRHDPVITASQIERITRDYGAWTEDGVWEGWDTVDKTVPELLSVGPVTNLSINDTEKTISMEVSLSEFAGGLTTAYVDMDIMTGYTMDLTIKGDSTADPTTDRALLFAVLQGGGAGHNINFDGSNTRPLIMALICKSHPDDGVFAWRNSVRFNGGTWDGAFFIADGYTDIKGTVTIRGHVSYSDMNDTVYFSTSAWDLTVDKFNEDVFDAILPFAPAANVPMLNRIKWQ